MAEVSTATATQIEARPDALVVLVGGRRLVVPWDRCSPRLAEATEQQRLAAELSPGGYGIHWPLIDEDLSIRGLVRDFGTG